MKHAISVNALEFGQALKDAANYVKRNAPADDPLNHVILHLNPKTKKIAVIACDGLGYYERKISLSKIKTKPSLPDQDKLCITSADAAALVKAISPRTGRELCIEVDDAKLEDNTRLAAFGLSNGLSTVFHIKTDLNLPDYAPIKARAEKGKKEAPALSNVQVPVNELMRAGKVFPGKGAFARIFTAKSINQGLMALLECKDDVTDISVIFMLNQQENAA